MDNTDWNAFGRNEHEVNQGNPDANTINEPGNEAFSSGLIFPTIAPNLETNWLPFWDSSEGNLENLHALAPRGSNHHVPNAIESEAFPSHPIFPTQAPNLVNHGETGNSQQPQPRQQTLGYVQGTAPNEQVLPIIEGDESVQVNHGETGNFWQSQQPQQTLGYVQRTAPNEQLPLMLVGDESVQESQSRKRRYVIDEVGESSKRSKREVGPGLWEAVPVEHSQAPGAFVAPVNQLSDLGTPTSLYDPRYPALGLPVDPIPRAVEEQKGHIKLNVDGTITNGPMGNGGMGGLFRDNHGVWLLGFSGKLTRRSILERKLWAIYRGLTISRSRNFSDVVLESSSLYAVKLIKNERSGPSACSGLVDDIRFMVNECNATITYVAPEENKCADALANLGVSQIEELQIWENPPNEVAVLLMSDMVMAALGEGDSGEQLKEIEKRVREAMEICKRDDRKKDDLRELMLLISQIKFSEGKFDEAFKVYDRVRVEPYHGIHDSIGWSFE